MTKKILVFQHSPYEPLGILIPLIRQRRIRIRYINFYRDYDSDINLDAYDGLIVLGGQQHPSEFERYPHLHDELTLIAKAIEKKRPCLGICLGAQLIAIALGGHCYPLEKPEFGWLPVRFTHSDSLFKDARNDERVFQWHQYAYQLPNGAQSHAISGNEIQQAFSYNDMVFGLQCHLEVDKSLLNRWFTHPEYLEHLSAHLSADDIQKMVKDTKTLLSRSMALGESIFNRFLDHITPITPVLNSMHAGC